MSIDFNRLILVCIYLLVAPLAIAQPVNVPMESRPDLFTYFTPGLQANPPGLDMISKGIMNLNSFDPNTSRSSGATGSAFLIYTDRTDDKICMCLAGHQIKDLFPGGVPVAGSAMHLNTDVYMNYFGTDSLSYGEAFQRILPPAPSKTYLGSVDLLDYYFDEQSGKDAALVLVRKSRLPSALLSALGVDFADNAQSLGNMVNLSHTHNYGQRIADNLVWQQNGTYFIKYTSQVPYAIGPGSSGSPLITRPASGTGVVKGITSQGNNQQSFNAVQKSDGNFYTYAYSTNPRFTKINVLETAIRRYCWQRNSEQIAANNLYKQTISINNSASITPYSQDVSVSSTSNLTGTSASLFPESSDILEITRLNAKVCNINGFALPATYPGSTKPWVVEIAGKEVIIAPGNNTEFSYTASGNSTLELSTVVITSVSGSGQQTIAGRTALQQQKATSDSSVLSVAVYPNPSDDGDFNVYIREQDRSAQPGYQLQVYAADGKSVFRAGFESEAPYLFSINGQSKGVYTAVITDASGKQIYATAIVYK